MTFHAVVSLMSSSVLFLSPESSILYTKLWKPQLVNNEIISLTGVDKYSRVLTDLASVKCVGSLVDSNNMFVMHRDGDHIEFVSMLWSSPHKTCQPMRKIRKWYNQTLGISPPEGRFTDHVEQDLWSLSVYEM